MCVKRHLNREIAHSTNQPIYATLLISKRGPEILIRADNVSIKEYAKV